MNCALWITVKKKKKSLNENLSFRGEKYLKNRKV